MKKLYIIRIRARGTYLCDSCSGAIPRGYVYWRHDPHGYARYRGETTKRYCTDCIPDRWQGQQGKLRIHAPATSLLTGVSTRSAMIPRRVVPVMVRLFDMSDELIRALADDPALMHQLEPAQFEDFVCNRLYEMGLEPRKTGATNQADGGIDIIFWPRSASAFPFLGAAQVKHRRNPSHQIAPGTVREFAGVISTHPFAAGLLVTNTSFSPNAEWFARQQRLPIRLRDFEDVRRWLANSFHNDYEWREIPNEVEVCPGTIIRVGRATNPPPAC